MSITDEDATILISLPTGRLEFDENGKPIGPMSVFATPGGLLPAVEVVRRKVDEFGPFEAATEEGRAHIKSVARAVSRSKTALDDAGLELNRGLKDLPKRIDAERKSFRDAIDAIRDELLAPVKAWEAADAKRKSGHETNILAIRQIADRAPALTLANLLRAKDDIIAMAPEDREEFAEEYALAMQKAGAAIATAIPIAEKAERDAEELDRLRREKAERDAADAEARREAENAARAEREKAANEARLKAEAEAAEQRLAAEQARAEAEKARAEANAIAEERKRREAEEAAQAARERDRKHRGEIHSAIMSALMIGCGLDEAKADQIVKLLASRGIPHVSIQY